MVSILIPTREEPFIVPTLNDLIKNATGDYEIIIGFDGYEEPIPSNDRIKIYKEPVSNGMRSMINKLVGLAKGEYIIKMDAHCIVSPGFDEELVKSHEDGWIMIPRQYSLHGATFTRNLDKRYTDYWYLTAPTFTQDDETQSLSTKRWHHKKSKLRVDGTMSFQGSFWFMKKSEFQPYDIVNYGGWGRESVELGNNFRLKGGKVVVNKDIWYAHLFKGRKYKRRFPLSKDSVIKSVTYAYQDWMVKHQCFMKSLVDKFNPPTWENFDWSKI